MGWYTPLIAFIWVAVCLSTLSFATPPSHPWFNHGRAPLDAGTQAWSTRDGSDCVRCHQKQAQEWSGSAHALAWADPIFQAGLAKDPQIRCEFCHSPLDAQSKKPMSQRRGVDCLTCHVREGKVFGPREITHGFHPVTADPRIRESVTCAGCHQFNFDNHFKTDAGQHTFALTDVASQNTYEEWREYQRRGGKETCVSCHMPKGNHRWRGAHDLAYLQAALRVETQILKDQVVITLRSHEVGHDFPTGDLFRKITIQIKRPGDRKYWTAREIGRKYSFPVGATGDQPPRLVGSSAIHPGEPLKTTVQVNPPFRFRIRYHLTEEKTGATVRTLHEQTLP